MFNQGQVCCAGSRVFIQNGPLVSIEQQNRVLGYIEKGLNEGAQLVTGGNKPQEQGYFVSPTIFADFRDEMTIAKEEIFGPVIAAMPYDDIDELINRANNSEYGLAAGV